jgi:hypothetical protein
MKLSLCAMYRQRKLCPAQMDFHPFCLSVHGSEESISRPRTTIGGAFVYVQCQQTKLFHFLACRHSSLSLENDVCLSARFCCTLKRFPCYFFPFIADRPMRVIRGSWKIDSRFQQFGKFSLISKKVFLHLCFA